jgi:hypothetical protein
MSEQVAPQRRTPRPTGALYLATTTAMLTVVASVMAWLQADDAAMPDRGSDSSEKAFMVILAIGLGGAVSVAAIAFVATKTALFK